MDFKDFISENADFFDSVIADIEVCDRRLILSIFEAFYEDTYENTRIIIESQEDDCFVFLLRKEYAINHKIRAKIKEIPFERVKKMIKSGKSFEVADVKLSFNEGADIKFSINPCRNKKSQDFLCLSLYEKTNVLIEKIDGKE